MKTIPTAATMRAIMRHRRYARESVTISRQIDELMSSTYESDKIILYFQYPLLKETRILFESRGYTITTQKLKTDLKRMEYQITLTWKK